MKKVAAKKIARKVTKFVANLPKDISANLTTSTTASQHLCLTNAGLTNGFTKEEIFEIVSAFGDIYVLIMLEGKSFSIASFKNKQSAIECYTKLNGSFCLKGETKPLYICYLECVDGRLIIKYSF